MQFEYMYGQDIYVATVKAIDEYAAVIIAQNEVYQCELKDKIAKNIVSTDYKLCVVFEGHQNVKL